MKIVKHIEQTTTMNSKTYLKNRRGTLLLMLLSFLFAWSLPALNYYEHEGMNNHWAVDAGPDQNICVGESAQLEASGANSYFWSPATGLSCTDCPDPTASPSATTQYFVMGDDGTMDSVLISVFTVPVINDITSTDPSDCNLPNGIIVIDAEGDSPLEYSVTGGLIWQANGIFTALSSGDYSIAVRNAGGACLVTGQDITLAALEEPQILNIIETDPTFCDIPNGSIVISSGGGISPLQYSIDGGQSWQGFNTFQLLSAGNYDIRVRNNDGSCEILGDTVSLTGSPDEAIINDIFVSNPSNCNESDGLITVLVANDNGNFEYSIDGGLSYQQGNSFNGLEEGIYHVFVRRLDGTCKTSGGFVDLQSVNRPVILGSSNVDPSDCWINDGNITILAFGPSTIEFSIDSGVNWQGSNIFSNLSAGTYQVAVRNLDGTCFTEGETIELFQATTPVINGINQTDPTACGVADGTITIDATGPGTLSYSIDGGMSFQADANFTGLLPGVYSIQVQENGTNCVSLSLVTLGASFNCIDTVQVTIPENTTSEVCLDPSVFNFPGLFTSVGFCGQGSSATVQATTIVQECVTLVPASGFTGVSNDLICTVHCFNNSASQCDTTYIEVVVSNSSGGNPSNCEDFFPVDMVSVDFDENPTPYCVPIPFSSLSNFNVFFQGQLITNPFSCTFAGVSYNYGLLPGGGFAGPYNLNNWEVDGSPLSGSFNNPTELLQLISDLDPTGFWQINAVDNSVFGGNPNSSYGNMEISDQNGLLTVLIVNATQPQGFTIELTNSGPHTLVVEDPGTNCLDTLFINGQVVLPDPEVVALSTPVNVPTAPYCLDGADLPNGTIVNVGYCGNPLNGAVPLVNDSCVIYVPNFNYAGQDEFCMIVCDGGFPQICDTTFFIVNVLPEIDTVDLTIQSGLNSLDTCFDANIIELPGLLDLVNICGINTNEINLATDDNCLSFNVVNNFSGITEICVEYCSGGICDTTIVLLNVEPPIVCDDIFDEESATLQTVTQEGFYCIPVAPGDIVGYTVTSNGSQVTNFTPCDFNNVTFYNYGSIPQTGPYTLDSWLINGSIFSGTYPDIQALVDAMNVFDPTGNWENNLFGLTITGGNPVNNYGNLEISHGVGGSFTISPDVAILPLGSLISVVGFGGHEVIVTAQNGCADTIDLFLEQYLISPETLFFETSVNTTISPICANTSELLGNLQSFNFCTLPNNGSVSVIGDTCVSYTPSLNYTGVDDFCLVVCDDFLPQVCDTFLVAINVQLPTDTVFIDADNVIPFDTCLDGSVLQLPGIIDTAIICGINPAEVEISFLGNCVNIDLEDTFVGTTTACVIHCTPDIPPICDTTFLVITFDGVFPCDPIFDPDQIIVTLNNDTGEVCLDLPPNEIVNYDVLLDGLTYAGQLEGCAFDSVYTYFYGLVFGQGNQGPYDIEWILNGNVQTGTVNNMQELVNLMNGLDPAGNWFLEPSIFAIISSNDAGNYGQLTITHFLGSVAELDPDFNGIPAGTLITFTGPGPHEIVLVEMGTGCEDTLFINAVDPGNIIQIITIEDTPSDIECIDTSGLAGNFLEMTICELPLNGTLEIDVNCFVYIPDPGFVGMDEACVEICDDLGNCEVFIIQITVNPLCSLFDFFPSGVQEIEVDNCSDIAAYCVPIVLDSLPNFGVLDNGFPYAGGFVNCNGNFTQIALDTGIHEVVFVHLNSQCADTLLIDIQCVDDNGCGIDPLTPLNLLANDCDETAQFCVGIPIGDLPNYLVTDINNLVVSNIGPCGINNQFVGVALDTGFHELIFADTVKGCADTFLVNVNCLLASDTIVNVEVVVQETETICFEDFGFPVSIIDSVVNVCPGLATGNATFSIDDNTWCVDIFGNVVGGDTVCLKAYFSDTCAILTIHANVIEPCPDYFPNDEIFAGTSCDLDSGLVCLPIPESTLSNMEILLNGQLFTEQLIACDFENRFVINYSDLSSMGLLGPYEVVNWNINTDGFNGSFEDAEDLLDLINSWDQTGTWDIETDISGNTLIVGGDEANIYSEMEVLQTFLGNLDTLQVTLQMIPTGFGMELPIGMSTIGFLDTTNQCSESIVAEVACVSSEVFLDTVDIGSADTFCLDLLELTGAVATVVNICEDAGGDDVLFTIDNECIIYVGLEPGIDTACIVVCDVNDVCDTTTMIITAVPAGGDTTIIAVNDTIVAGEGQVILIDVFQNDTFNTLTDFEIIDFPANGQAVFLPNGSINYVPNENFCDDVVPDTFTYEICNQTGCDTATVFVLVECSSLEIFNAFSPNNDGINDFFKIRGLQNFPNHKLYVYNRWGNLVLEATDYQSDWFGTWDGNDLPDGTYFYYLDLGEGGQERSGYVQLIR